jgi:hypothetical protein
MNFGFPILSSRNRRNLLFRSRITAFKELSCILQQLGGAKEAEFV